MTLFDKFVTMLAGLGTVSMKIEDGVAHCEVELGSIQPGIEYKGLWGAGTTAGQMSTKAVFEFGDLYDEGDPNDPVLGTATICVSTDSEDAGLVYTSGLESVLSDMLAYATDNMLTLSGSEQGMQDVDGCTQVFNADLHTMFKDVNSDVLEPVLH